MFDSGEMGPHLEFQEHPAIAMCEELAWRESIHIDSDAIAVCASVMHATISEYTIRTLCSFVAGDKIVYRNHMKAREQPSLIWTNSMALEINELRGNCLVMRR